MKHHLQDMYVSPISNEYDTELWDLSKIYNIKEDTTLSGIKVIGSLCQLKEELLGLQKEYKIIAITNIQIKDLDIIYPVLKENNVVIVGLLKDTICVSLEERGRFKYVRYYDLKSQILTYLPFLRKLVKRNRGGIYKYDYLLAGANYYPNYTNNFLRIHQIKYDEYLHAQDSSNIIAGKYILYIGSAPTSHPMYCGAKNSLNHQEYMNTLCSYLDKVEKSTGLKIVISAHPKGKYNKEEWGNREIYTGNTADLIHHCEGVICHWSTSLINVILEHKPLQVIYSSKLLSSSFRYTMVTGLSFAEECHANICDMKGEFKWDMSVDAVAYNRFLEKEIIDKDHQSQSNAALICDHLRHIIQRESKIIR